jgi:hypothetical protein
MALMLSRPGHYACVLFALPLFAPKLSAQCSVHWSDAFPPGAAGFDGEVLALTSGPTADGTLGLYVGGSFAADGGAVGNHVAMWDGDSWSPLGSGLDHDVFAVLVFDDDDDGPNLPLLYAAGSFTNAGGVWANRIAAWNGSTWSALSSGMNSTGVRALVVFDDDDSGPNPPALYAAGFFTIAGGVLSNRIAKWDGSSWSPLGSGTSNGINALAVFDDDGAGPNKPALYAGGDFLSAGDLDANRIAKWDGSTWSPLGSGMDSPVRTLAVFDVDGAGPLLPALFAGGSFTHAGGNTANRIARWNGSSWSAVGSGTSGEVLALSVFDADGAGSQLPKLVAGGEFTSAGGQSAMRIATWNGASWSNHGTGVTYEPSANQSSVMSLAAFDDDGAGPNAAVLYAGGRFTRAGAVVGVENVARWDGASWSVPVAPGGLDDATWALTAFDADGGGSNPPVLVAGGVFTSAGNVGVNRIGAWNGSSWSPLGNGLNGSGTVTAYAMTVFDSDGGGPGSPALYVGGRFTSPGQAIAKWNGTSWSALGGGLTGNSAINAPGHVYALATFDADGVGPNLPELYAGGAFQHAGSPAFVDNLARWNGSSWSQVGGGAGFEGQGNSVMALAVFDEDGEGPTPPALFVGGNFTAVQGGTFPAMNIARWNGTSWATLGSGLNYVVNALAVFDDDGDGPHPEALFAAGAFTTAGGVSANRVAKWDGASWSALGSGVNALVSDLSVFDQDGAGPNPPALYAGGWFTSAGGVSASRIARWDGASWSALGGGIDGGGASVFALTVFDADESGPMPAGLFVGGDFTRASGDPSWNLASWIGCGSTFVSFCSGDGSLPTPCPCVPPSTVPNPAAAVGHGCANSLNGSGALLSATGAVSPDTVKITVDVAPNYNAFAFLLKGNAVESDGVAGGDGIRCVAGQLIRFGGHFAGTNGDPIGQWCYPNAVQVLPVSTATAQPHAKSAYYQLYYRNAATDFCNPATTNYSNGGAVQWP